MNLNRITITGADDSIRPMDLVEISKEFPFVEWGILFSRKRQGKEPRYPSHQWLQRLISYSESMKLSAHLCGGEARDLFAGTTAWFSLWGPVFGRVQLNGFSDLTEIESLTVAVGSVFNDGGQDKRFIMQATTPVAIVAARELGRHALEAQGTRMSTVEALYDPSGGQGIETREWPVPPKNFSVGYAGGIGPNNIADAISALTAVKSPNYYWLDMESRVRSNDGKQFDLDLVRRVLTIARVHIVEP